MKVFILAVLLLSSRLLADQFSFLFYNDLFAHTDKHFTNGVSIGWIDDAFHQKSDANITSFSSFVYDTVNKLPCTPFSSSKRYNAGVSVSQYMFTPKDINVTYPQYDDIPYVGYLSVDVFLFEVSVDDSFEEFRLSLGVVGKESGAEFVQKSIHKITDSEEPKGWDTQLGTRYVANLLYRYGEISWQRHEAKEWSADWFNHGGFQAGNYIVNAFAGTMFRFGYNYTKNFNLHYPYLKEDAAMLRIDKPHEGFGCSFSFGVNAKALAYSYVIDEAKNRGYHIDAKVLSATAYGGVDLLYNRHRLIFFYQTQTPYIEEQSELEKFGGFSYIYQF